MEFKPGLIVSMRHYSDPNLHKGVVQESTYETLKIKISDSDDFSVRYQVGDPIALGFEMDNLVFISSCNILSYNESESELVLKSDSLETLSNKRLFERFPTSFNASVKIGSSKTEYQVYIKNISFNGMLACSKVDFPLYQEMKVDFDIGTNITLKAVIIRKSKEMGNFEYGLKLVYTDPHTPSLIKKYLQQLRKEQSTYVSTNA